MPEFASKTVHARRSAVKRFLCAHSLVYRMGTHVAQRDPEEVWACGARARHHAETSFSPAVQRQRLARLVAPWMGPGAMQGSWDPAERG